MHQALAGVHFLQAHNIALGTDIGCEKNSFETKTTGSVCSEIGTHDAKYASADAITVKDDQEWRTANDVPEISQPGELSFQQELVIIFYFLHPFYISYAGKFSSCVNCSRSVKIGLKSDSRVGPCKLLQIESILCKYRLNFAVCLPKIALRVLQTVSSKWWCFFFDFIKNCC